MRTYRVTWEILMDGDNPKDAVAETIKWMKRDDCNWAYAVKNMKTEEVVIIHTEELETEE